jgi:uncharacterized membrane protein YfcA
VNHPAILVLIGIFVGVYSGIMGLGGGTVMIPIMILLLGLRPKQALGTSLAVMLPPVTLTAVLTYWKSGNVDWWMALWIALGVPLGMYVGARFVNSRWVDEGTAKTIFGLVLVYVAAYTVLGKDHLVRSMILSALMVLVAVAVVGATRWYDAAR